MDERKQQSQYATIHAMVQQSMAQGQGSISGRLTRVGMQMGNYKLIQLLAQGGFAEVYIGEHVHLGTFAAIKLLYAQLTGEELRAFREEARLVARLRHPHIISILDFDVQDGTPFIVMDYAPHGTLRQRHPKGTVLAPAVVQSYLSQVAAALQYAHEKRVIHRDVKPENILLGWQDEILLSDFGIAVTLLSLRTGIHHTIVGTVAYMSPEQFMGRAYPASDQYALGIVAYDWLCGRCPFIGSIAEVAAQQVNADPPAPRAFNPAISPALEQVLFKALAKDPAQRYPSVNEFAAAFTAACSEQSSPHEIARPGVDSVNSSATVVADAASSIDKSPDEQPTIYAVPGTSAAIQEAHKNDAAVAHEPVVQADTPLPATVPAQLPDERRFSRRTMLRGATGLASLGVAGGAILWAIRTQPFKGLQVKVSPTPTATPPPAGSALIAPYHGHIAAVFSLAWSYTDGTYIVSGSDDSTARVWNSGSGADFRVFSGHSGKVTGLAWSPDGKKIASASYDQTVRVWSALDEQDAGVTYSKHSDVVNTVSWSSVSDAQKQYIASASNDKTVRVWKPDGSEVATYSKHSDAVFTVAWSPDGQYIASGGADNTVQVWDPTKIGQNAAPVVTFTHHSDSITMLAWSPDGKYIASAGGGNDKSVMVWLALIGGNPIFIYKGHSAAVNAVAWSPDGQYLASGGDDGTVQIWKFDDGSGSYTYSGHGGNAVHALMWSPDQQYIASGGADKTVQVWSKG